MPPYSTRHWQDNAHNNKNCYWCSILINGHSSKENEVLDTLKNVVFDKMP